MRICPEVCLAVLLCFAAGRAAGEQDGPVTAEQRAYARQAMGKAEAGEPVSQAELGMLYCDGRYGLPKDEQKGIYWLQKAADNNEVRAQIILAGKFYYGHCTTRDYVKAAILFRKAALAGDINGQMMLGKMYRNGEGLKRNDAKAAGWYLKAAAAGDPGSMVGLSTMYFAGEGVKKDKAEAMKWALVACARSEESCPYLKKLSRADMTKEELEEGRKRAAPLLR